MARLKTIRLSSLRPLDLESLRSESLTRAREERRAGRMRSVYIDKFEGEGRPILSDGRHRVLEAMRGGETGWPAIVRYYGPRGGFHGSEPAELILDGLP